MGVGFVTRRAGTLVKDISGAEVTLDFSSVTYDGSEHAPVIQSVKIGETELRDMQDYYAVIMRQQNAGDYNIIINGIGEYGGVKTVPWHITKAQGHIRVEPARVTIQGAAGTTATVNITKTGDGEVTVSQSQYVTAQVDGDQIALTSIAEGSDTLTVTLGDGRNYTGDSTQLSVDVKLQTAHIYGVEWDGQPGTEWVRTDDAMDYLSPVPYYYGMEGNPSSPFDECLPWSGMQRESHDKTGEVVAIPKFWYKLESNGGTGLKIQISDAEQEGFVVSPAHMKRFSGDTERDVVYVGRYHCDADGKSTTGSAQMCSITHSNARTKIKSLGDKVNMLDWATRFTIFLLYLVEFANWDSQSCIGYGCSESGSKVANGMTDSLPYHTGTTASSRDAYGYTQYRNIEGLWDNVRDWLEGCYNNTSGLNIILDPSKYADNANGVCVGMPTSGYPSKFTVSSTAGFPMFYPTESSGSTTTYSCDYWSFDTSGPCINCGGYYGHDLNYGLFYFDYYSTADTYRSIGARLREDP